VKFTSRIRIDAPPAVVIKMLATSEYAERRAQVQHATQWHAQVSGAPPGPFTVQIHRQLSTEAVPTGFRSFIGESVELVQTEHWDGTSARIEITATNQPVRASGTATMSADEAGTTLTLTGDVVAAVPLFGHRIEKAIVDALDQVFDHEAKVAASWLAEQGPMQPKANPLSSNK
jgi:hypothetical protein